MDAKKLLKNPLLLLSSLIILCYLVLPFVTIKISFFGVSVSESKTGLTAFFMIFKKFNFVSIFSLLVLASAVFINIISLKNDYEKHLKIAIWSLLISVVATFIFVAKDSLSFVGFGLWLTILFTIGILFYKNIEELVEKHFNKNDEITEETKVEENEE